MFQEDCQTHLFIDTFSYPTLNRNKNKAKQSKTKKNLLKYKMKYKSNGWGRICVHNYIVWQIYAL